MDLIKLGKLLKQHREALGLSQNTVAEKAELDRTYISMLERGKKNPTVFTLYKIGKVIEMKPSQILSEIDL